MQPKKRPAAYLRVSTRIQEERETILAQEMALREHFKQIGLDPDKDVLWYRDDGVSGGTSFYNRGGGSALLEDAQSGFIDYVAVFSISRLSRNNDYDFFEFASKMHKLGISIKAVSQGIDTGQRGGKFMAGLFALMAAEERENISAASKAGSLAGAKQGKWQGKASYGYKIGEDGKLEIVEGEAKIVRQIYKMYLSGKGYKPIARHLRDTERGIWSYHLVSQILQKALYTGKAYYNKTRRYHVDGKIHVEQRPKEQWIELEVPRIISDELFERAQFVRQERLNNLSPARTSEYILSQVVCVRCGTKYHRKVEPYYSKRQKKKIFYYNYTHRELTCPQANKGIRKGKLEGPVWAEIEALIRNPTLWKEHIKPQDRGIEIQGQELQKVEEALKANSEALGRLEEAYFVDASISKERYSVLSPKLYAKALRLIDRRDKIRAFLASEEREAERIRQVEEYLMMLKDAGLTSTPEERSGIVTALIKRVLVKAEGWGNKKKIEIVIEWNT